MPKASLVTPDRINVLMTRGDACELASWRATSVSVKTTARNVRVAEAMMPSTVAASPESTCGPVGSADLIPRLGA